MDQSLRLFIALRLSPEVKTQLLQQQDYIQLILDKTWFRFTAEEQLHLTVLFLGIVQTTELSIIKQGMKFATQRLSPFSLQTSPMSAFPSMVRPSILWTGVEDESNQLQALHQALRLQLAKHLKPNKHVDHKIFKPHLTLARVNTFGKNDAIASTLANAPDYPPIRWQVDSIDLLASKKATSSHSYELLHTESLGHS